MTEHQSSFDTTALIDTRKERVSVHDVPFFANDENQQPVPLDEFFRDNQEIVQVTRELIADAKRFVPVEADEDMNGEEYKLRVIEELIKRIQWRGDYIQGTDRLFSHLEDQDLEHTDLILTALEAQANEIRKSLGESNVPDTVSMKRLIQSEAEAILIAATQPEQELPKPPEPEQETEALTDIDEAPIVESSRTPEAPEPPLQTHFNFAVVAIPDRAVQDRRRAAAHSFNNNVNRRSRRDRVVSAVSETIGKLPIPIVNRVASRVTRGIGNALSHPVQVVWQNNLAKDVFEQEHVRFATSLETTIKAHTDSSVPIAITEELIDIALKHAQDARAQQSRGRRTWNRLSDSVKAVTGAAQTSEQEMAREWLERQLRLPATQRNRELQRVISQTYDEQTALAERFATPVPQGMDIERANIAGSIIRPELNERRTRLAKGSVAEQRTNLELKKLIARYSKGEITDTESLVHQINRFIETEFIRNLPAADRRAFNSPEVANNIILLAEEIKKDWEKYSKTDSAGLSAWDKVHFDVYVGRAEWRGPRGPVERGWLTNWLTKRLADNPTVLNRATGGAFALFKDSTIVPVVAYGGAWVSATLFGVGRTGARIAGGLVSSFGLAGLRRSGIDLARTGRRGIEGGTVHDVTLRSFESAYGRRFDNPEIQQVLVEQTPADEMTRNILRDSIRIQTDQDAVRLLTVLADARAKLHLTDLSDTRELLYKTQNYIRYTEGQDNQESLELRRAIHNGVLAVEAYASNHSDFLNKYGGRVFSGMPTEYYHRIQMRRPIQREDMGMLERFTLIREAQLRFSSTDERRMRRWLQRTLRLPQSEIDSMMSGIHPFFAEQITRENSLRRKEARIQQLRAVQLAESVVDSAAATGVMIPVVALASELPDMASHTIHGASTRGMSGLGEYVTHWREVMQGEASPETSLQRAVLAAREWWNRPQVAVPVEQAPVAGSGHDVVVSGTRIDLDPVTHKYDMIALGPDGNPILDAHGKPILLIDNGQVDPVTGKVTADYIHPDITIQEYAPTEALTGQAAVEHWLKLSTKIDKIKWWVHNPKIEQHLYDSTSESASGMRTIEFRLSDVGVAHQGTESIDVGQLVKDNKIAFALTLPGHLHEPIIIDASSGVVHNGVLKLDPDDYSHFVKVGSEVRAIGDIARDLVKQQELSKFPTGNLGTDVLHREPLLHLSDAHKSGHVQAVYIENHNGQVIEHSFSTIRAGGTVEIGGGPAASTPDIVLPNGMTIHIDNTQAVPFLQRIPAGFAPLQRAAGRLSDLALAAMPFGGHRNMDRSTSAQGPRSEREHRNLIENIIDARREYALAMEKVERNINRQQNLREVSRLRAELAIMQDKLRRSTYNQGVERRPAAPPPEIPPSDPGETPPPPIRPNGPPSSSTMQGISDAELIASIERERNTRPEQRPTPREQVPLSRDLSTATLERYHEVLGDKAKPVDNHEWQTEFDMQIVPQIRKLLQEGYASMNQTQRESRAWKLTDVISDALWTVNKSIITRRESAQIADVILERIMRGEITLADLPEETTSESQFHIKQPSIVSQTPETHNQFNPPDMSEIPDWLREEEIPPPDKLPPSSNKTESPLYPDDQWFQQLPTINGAQLKIDGPEVEGRTGGEICMVGDKRIPYEVNEGIFGFVNIRRLSADTPEAGIMYKSEFMNCDVIHRVPGNGGVSIAPDNDAYMIIGDAVYKYEEGGKFKPVEGEDLQHIQKRINVALKMGYE